MSAAEIISILALCLSAAVSVTALLTWLYNKKQRHRSEGAAEMRTTASLDTIKLQNENLLTGNREICNKLDDQNTRLARLEQTVKDSDLAQIPRKIAALDESVKSAHRRIDKIERK